MFIIYTRIIYHALLQFRGVYTKVTELVRNMINAYKILII